MMHERRTWCVGNVNDAQELADKLTGHTWTLCTGFRHRGYLYLNDSTSEDGAQEYGVVKEAKDAGDSFLQVESITFGWCDKARALDYIERISAGEYDGSSFARKVNPRIETPKLHSRCHLCA